MTEPKLEMDEWDKTRPPRVTRHLNRQVLCGHCQFRCCNSTIFHTELTREESVKYSLPIVFPQEGHCRCLGDAGCIHGSDRPVACKIFPIQIKDGKALVYHWAQLQCPTPKDYVLEKEEGGKYHYVRRPDLKGPKKGNSAERITLDHPIEQFPDVLETCSNGVAQFWGESAVAEMRNALDALNKGEEGFGL